MRESLQFSPSMSRNQRTTHRGKDRRQANGPAAMPGNSLQRFTPRMPTMFAKQAQIAVAAIAFSIAGGAFAQSVERNVFDTETHNRIPAAQSADGLTREAVQAAYVAKRAAEGISSFNPESAYVAQNQGAGSALVALFTTPSATTELASASGLMRAEVRAEVIAARAHGEMNPFDTETNLRIEPSTRVPAATTLAQR
jgi:hypothetical protein